MFRKSTMIALATTAVLGAAMLAAPSAAEAAVRARVQDHRGPNLGGQALPGGPRIKCVIPFCSHSFNPQGTRPRVQDHRPGPNVPPIHGAPRPVSNSATNKACLANHTCVRVNPPGIPGGPTRPPTVPR